MTENGDLDAFIPLSRKWMLISIICGTPVFFLLAYFGHPDKGLVATFSIGITMLVIRASWNLRTRPWFWPIVSAIVVAHTAAVSSVTFPHVKFAILVFAPIVFFDFGIMYSIFWFAEKWYENAQRRKFEDAGG